MRNEKLIPGIILVFIGALILLDNFGYFNFSWSVFISMWPVVLIIAGVNLVLAHNRSGGAMFVKILVLLVGMGFIVWQGTHADRDAYRWRFSAGRDDSGNNREVKGSYTEPFNPVVQTASLNITGGAASYTLLDTTNQLFYAETRESNTGYSLKTTIDSTNAVVDFDMGNNHSRHHGFFFFDKGRSQHADIKLNVNPVWDIDVESGASSLKLDLSKFKVRKLSFEGGAASCDIKMGQPLASTNINIQTGASSVNISVPQNSACRISTDTGLSSKHIEGFNKKGDSEYETPGFEQAANKMYIHLEGGFASFKVTRY